MVKIVVEDRHLAVYVDPRNRGEWEECVMIEDMPLPEGWAREAHVGLTASTGQLVDNHDIISLVTYAGISLHFSPLYTTPLSTPLHTSPQATLTYLTSNNPYFPPYIPPYFHLFHLFQQTMQ